MNLGSERHGENIAQTATGKIDYHHQLSSNSEQRIQTTEYSKKYELSNYLYIYINVCNSE